MPQRISRQAQVLIQHVVDTTVNVDEARTRFHVSRWPSIGRDENHTYEELLDCEREQRAALRALRVYVRDLENSLGAHR